MFDAMRSPFQITRPFRSDADVDSGDSGIVFWLRRGSARAVHRLLEMLLVNPRGPNITP